MPNDPKSGLTALLAIGKPKSDMPADEPDGDEAMPGMMDEEASENCIKLPPGFKAPDDATDGESFTTTVRGKIEDGQFHVEEIGGMSMDGKAAPMPGESDNPEAQADEPDPMAEEAATKRNDMMAAKKAFQRQ